MSVYCGYCGQRGHNKLGCPERKKVARENPDSYVARAVEREERERAQRVANRTCTYCSKPGHNRRGCKTLKADKAAVLQRNREYRDQFAKAMSSTGFGVGALVELPDGGYKDKWLRSTLYMVTEVAWENIDFRPQAYVGRPGSAYNFLNKNVVRMRPISSKGYDQKVDEQGWRNTPPKDDRWIALNEVANLLPGELFSPDIREYIASQNKPRPENPAFEHAAYGENSRLISPAVGVTYSEPDEFHSVIPQSLRVGFCFESNYGQKDRWALQRVPEDSFLWNGTERVKI